MNIDSFFTIGKSHKVCEDYALCNPEKHNVFGISDGCSSSKNTDFGSRIMLKAFEHSIDSIVKNPTHIMQYIHVASSKILNSFNGTLQSAALDATLNVGFENSSGEIEINVIGDGYIVAVFKNGNYSIYEIDYSDNAPYYITYMFNSARDLEYKKVVQVKNFNCTTYDKLGNLLNETKTVSNSPYENLFFPKDDYISVSLFSDGLKTLIPNDISADKIPLHEVVNQLITFPQPNGEFVKRKCLSFLKKNKEHMFYDDFSMATCYIG